MFDFGTEFTSYLPYQATYFSPQGIAEESLKEATAEGWSLSRPNPQRTGHLR
jgi:hypothetical protein